MSKERWGRGNRFEGAFAHAHRIEHGPLHIFAKGCFSPAQRDELIMRRRPHQVSNAASRCGGLTCLSGAKTALREICEAGPCSIRWACAKAPSNRFPAAPAFSLDIRRADLSSATFRWAWRRRQLIRDSRRPGEIHERAVRRGRECCARTRWNACGSRSSARKASA